MLTDVLFVTSLHGLKNVIGWIFVLLPVTVNLALVIFFLRKEMKNEAFHSYVGRNTSVVAGVSIVSVLNLDALNLLRSRLFGVGSFDAPISDRGDKMLRFSGLTNTILVTWPSNACLV